MVGHLLEYHPGVAQAARRSPTPASSATSTTSTPTGSTSASCATDENALWSLGAHDVSVLLHLFDGEEPHEVLGARRVATCATGVEDVVFCYLRFPSGRGRAHAPLLARPAQGAPLHRRRLEADGDLRRHGARAQAHRLRQGLRPATSRSYGEYITRSGDIMSPQHLQRGAAADRVPALRRVRPRPAPSRAPAPRARCAWCACSRRCSARSTTAASRRRLPGAGA